ncbi:helix-turn-helix domain-containing protein [Peribacillus asahii]|uniref:helix-turn-helix domain-containing protein n=1 Tax=Peribacillus asahii TaxID=228899 RepID=UPI003816B7D4
MGIGDRIKQKRKERRMTQVELGTAVNVSSQVISNWERGYTDPNHDDVARLAEVLECSTEFLHGRKIEQASPTLSSKDEKDIAKKLESILNDLDSDSGLAFDGEPLDETTRELVKAQIESNLRLAKQLAKKKFTPKKYRDDSE